MTMTCPVCNGSSIEPIFSFRDIPIICNQLYAEQADALAAPSGDVELQVCKSCAFVWNSRFEPEKMEYAPGYENALHFSPSFQTFATELAEHLVKTYDLKGKHIVEIGCGDGHMLDLMSQQGVATATGFDPSMLGKETPFTEREGVTIEPSYFTSENLNRSFDAILCRHVLEHLENPVDLLRDIRKAIGDKKIPIYFEVPNAEWMLKSVSLWDVIYEHVGYWSAPSIMRAMVEAGFEPKNVRQGYSDQFLMIEALPATATPKTNLEKRATDLVNSAMAFSEAATAEITKWEKTLSGLNNSAVVWGAGSKGITFANALSKRSTAFSTLVDLNPRKHALYAPGVGLQVVAPDALIENQPEMVLIANGLYAKEIEADLLDRGLTPSFAIIAS